MKKKIAVVTMVAIAGACLASCHHEETSSASGNASTSASSAVEFVDGSDYLQIKNGFISLRFAKDNGSLTSFKNVISGTDYLNGTVGGDWAMMVDLSTSDPFLSNPTGASTVLVSSRKQTMTYKADVNESEVDLHFTYAVSFSNGGKSYNGISVTQIVSLKALQTTAEFNYLVENQIANSVVVSFTGAQLTGLKDNDQSWTLFWPYKEGKLYEDGLKTVRNATDSMARMTMVYPVPSSLQLVQLYSEKESLYYYVKDSSREYKEFNFGAFINTKQYDYQGVNAADKVSLSCTQYPFVSSNAKKNLFSTVLGVSNHGDYYDGADHYRSFLTESKMTRTLNAYVKNWTGFTALIGSRYGNKHFASYTQATGYSTTYSSWASLADPYGIYSTALLGWHDGGFDSLYPDYNFISGDGFGESGFKTAMTKAHSDGNKMFAYINSHIADKRSAWGAAAVDGTKGLTNLYGSAIKTKGFTPSLAVTDYPDYMIEETYGTATSYFAMCPKSAPFQNALISAATRLRKNGVDGLWLDQLMEMPANLCFDASHGHKTPATAYGEGYGELLQAIEDAFTSNGAGDYLFAAEGTCDAYIQYVDVCGYQWARKLGAKDTAGDNHNMSPEITRYALPAKFLGIEGAGTTTGSDDEFARAFVMCDPFLGNPYKPSVGVFTSLYAQDPDYLSGTFRGTLGCACSDENFIYGVCVAENGESLILNYYNYNLDAASKTTMTLDLGRLGLTGSISSVTDERVGSSVSFAGNVISLPDTASMGIGSLKIVLK